MVSTRTFTGDRKPPHRASRLVLAVAAAAALHAAGAHAQTLTGTLDDLLQDEVDEQAEDGLVDSVQRIVEEQVESDVVDAVGEVVESDVVDAVGDQVESVVVDAVGKGVVESVEQQVETSVTDGVEEQVESGIVGDVERQVESVVIDTVEQQVEDGVIDGVERQVEEGVVDRIEQQVEDGVVDGVARQVEDGVIDGVVQQVEDGVIDGIVRQVEDGVIDGVAQQVEDGVIDGVVQQVEDGVVDGVVQQVEDGVVDGVVRQVEDGVIDGVVRQVEDGVIDGIAGPLGSGLSGVDGIVEAVLESDVTEAAGERVDSTIRDVLGAAAEDLLGADADDVLGAADADDILDGTEAPVEGALESAANQASPPGGEDGGSPGESNAAGQQGRTPRQPSGAEADAARAERFVAAVDGDGRRIERNVWIILVPSEHTNRIAGWGFDIEEQRVLPALDRVMVRVTAPEDRDIAEAALELALDAPGTRVDFNHVYKPEGNETAESAAAAATGLSPILDRAAVGIVDTAVLAQHEALRSAVIVQKDFVPFEAARPSAHGTAVASILVGQSTPVEARLPRGKLYAASVFFEDDAGNAAATTESLVAALEWLRAEAVPVVNMSLSGPPNAVLEAALEIATQNGTVVVAAVGNNGPAGKPLYPAAYDCVVGVTAVDAKNHVYRYASRGPQVTFAAPGVRVSVASSRGGYRKESGTSMAAPYAAAIIARSLAIEARSPEDVLARLKAGAIDLGEKAFDEVYGFGLITAARH